MDKKLLAPTLDADALAEARRMIGMPIRVEQWNYEATRDTIRHYAWGLGDDNPLWCDPDYAAGTRWGGIVAPPTFFYAIFDAVVAPGLPDIQWIYSGADCEFFEPIRRGDEITADAAYVDARALSGKRVANMLVQTGDVSYRNQHGALTTRVQSHTFRIARQGASGGLSYEPRPEQRYTHQQLEAIERAVLAEERRGGTRRYWEDVQLGDPLGGTVRGPINRLDMTCYYAGAVGTSGYKSTRLKWLYSHWARHDPERLPNNYDPSYYAAAVSPSIGHQDAEVATSEIGMPGPYDNGPQRIGMLASCVTNWMGDDGFVRKLSVRVKLPVIFGDTTYTRGRVGGKREIDGRGLVDCEIWAENQLSQTTARGSAEVELPRRPR
ncbi:MAG: MaoC family dehydratase N-terminal domain-containing protein [Burkholderiales bacterium]|nr:MAG: MaoC family dehydratase N-terminal domain-containing protein [Burkholderiales bacterium]